MFTCSRVRVIPCVPHCPPSRVAMKLPRSALASVHVPVARRSTATRPSRPSEDHHHASRSHSTRRTFTIPTTEELQCQIKTAFLRAKTHLETNFKGYLKTTPISPEYPLDRLHAIQDTLAPELRGKSLDKDPVFVRDYLMDTYVSHKNSAEGFAVSGLLYGVVSIIAGPLLLIEGIPFLVGVCLLAPNVLFWTRCRHHSKIADHIRHKILLVEQKLRETHHFNSFLHYKCGEATHKYAAFDRQSGTHPKV